jgi:hypothetical protein
MQAEVYDRDITQYMYGRDRFRDEVCSNISVWQRRVQEWSVWQGFQPRPEYMIKTSPGMECMAKEQSRDGVYGKEAVQGWSVWQKSSPGTKCG